MTKVSAESLISANFQIWLQKGDKTPVRIVQALEVDVKEGTVSYLRYPDLPAPTNTFSTLDENRVIEGEVITETGTIIITDLSGKVKFKTTS